MLSAPGVAGLLDLDRPIALLMVSVPHFVPIRDDLAGIVARYRTRGDPGVDVRSAATSPPGEQGAGPFGGTFDECDEAGVVERPAG